MIPISMFESIASFSMFESIASFSMFESIAYIVLGFAASFFSLEAVWHFTACKIHDKSIKPCFYTPYTRNWPKPPLYIGRNNDYTNYDKLARECIDDSQECGPNDIRGSKSQKNV